MLGRFKNGSLNEGVEEKDVAFLHRLLCEYQSQLQEKLVEKREIATSESLEGLLLTMGMPDNLSIKIPPMWFPTKSDLSFESKRRASIQSVELDEITVAPLEPKIYPGSSLKCGVVNHARWVLFQHTCVPVPVVLIPYPPTSVSPTAGTCSIPSTVLSSTLRQRLWQAPNGPMRT